MPHLCHNLRADGELDGDQCTHRPMPCTQLATITHPPKQQSLKIPKSAPDVYWCKHCNRRDLNNCCTDDFRSITEGLPVGVTSNQEVLFLVGFKISISLIFLSISSFINGR